MSEDDLCDERAGLGGLEFESRVETRRNGGVVDRYRFVAQDSDLREGNETREPGADKPSKFATVEAIAPGARTVDLYKAAARAELNPSALVPVLDACPAALTARVRVVNLGARGVRPPVTVHVRLLRGGTEVASVDVATTGVLLPGESERVEARFPIPLDMPDGGSFDAVVDPDGGSGFGAVRECIETDNAIGPVPAACMSPT